jgi:FkbM family methyltransferase
MKPVITHSVGMQNIIYTPDGKEEMIKDVFVNGGYDCYLDGYDLRILDIGAHVGSFSLWAMRRFPGSVIYSYEPVRELYECLVKNTEFYPNVYPFNSAVSTYPEYVIKVNKDRYFLSGVMNNHAKNDDIEIRKVPSEHPSTLPVTDIVKVDTEGAEADILMNMSLSKTTVVIVEAHSPGLFEEVKAYMEKIGFYIWQIFKYSHSGVGEFVFVNSNHWNPKIRSLYLDKDSFKAVLK